MASLMYGNVMVMISGRPLRPTGGARVGERGRETADLHADGPDLQSAELLQVPVEH